MPTVGTSLVAYPMTVQHGPVRDLSRSLNVQKPLVMGRAWDRPSNSSTSHVYIYTVAAYIATRFLVSAPQID